MPRRSRALEHRDSRKSAPDERDQSYAAPYMSPTAEEGEATIAPNRAFEECDISRSGHDRDVAENACACPKLCRRRSCCVSVFVDEAVAVGDQRLVGCRRRQDPSG